MSEYLADIGSLYATSSLTGATTSSTSSSSSTSLDMTDFLQLMVAQFENQSIDDTADTSDMLNQLVQMQVVQAINSITEAAEMMTASSMVGKEVTIGQYDSNGVLQTSVGTVTGTGTSNGEQVFFVNGNTYAMSDILAIGRLPGYESSTEEQIAADTADTTTVEGTVEAEL